MPANEPANILLRRPHGRATACVRVLPWLGVALMILSGIRSAAKLARRIADRLPSRTEVRGTLINLAAPPVGSRGRRSRGLAVDAAVPVPPAAPVFALSAASGPAR